MSLRPDEMVWRVGWNDFADQIGPVARSLENPGGNY